MHAIGDLPSGLYILKACESWSKGSSLCSAWLSLPSVNDFGIFASPPAGAGVAAGTLTALATEFVLVRTFELAGVGVGRPATWAEIGDLPRSFREINSAAEPNKKTVTSFVRF